MTKEDQDLYSGLIRLHILHHAAQEAIFGLAIIEELGRHGYKLSAGTIYPLLHGLERKGYLRSKEERRGKTVRRLYTATAKGKRALEASKEKVQELFGELFEDET
jgi:DNA-binding PadR family transcriptional regulator